MGANNTMPRNYFAMCYCVKVLDVAFDNKLLYVRDNYALQHSFGQKHISWLGMKLSNEPGNRIKSWGEHVKKKTRSTISFDQPGKTQPGVKSDYFSSSESLHFLWEMYTIHICKHTKIIVNSHETVSGGDIPKGAAHASAPIAVFSNSARVRLSDQKGLDLIFYEDVQEEQENIKVEEEEIPEDKDNERYDPERSESSSDNADTPEDHQGEKGTFLSKNEKITWSSSHCASQGRMTARGEIQDDLFDWQFPMVRTLSQC